MIHWKYSVFKQIRKLAIACHSLPQLFSLLLCASSHLLACRHTPSNALKDRMSSWPVTNWASCSNSCAKSSCLKMECTTKRALVIKDEKDEKIWWWKSMGLGSWLVHNLKDSNPPGLLVKKPPSMQPKRSWPHEAVVPAATQHQTYLSVVFLKW